MKRLEYADYAKAVAIFLVVLGHTHPGYLPGYGRCACDATAGTANMV